MLRDAAMVPASQTDVDPLEAYELLTLEEREEFDRLFHVEPLREFIPRVSPHLPPPEHTRVLTDLFERARFEEVFALVSMPPRHAKTVTVQHAIAWWLSHSPADVLGYFTYSDTKGKSKSRGARDLAIAAGIDLDKASRNMSEWRTLHGGGLLAGGRGGGLTGDGITGFFVIDDPFKNYAEAKSEIVREGIREWLNKVAETRLEAASLIVLHTRWHEDDMIGWLLAEQSDRFEHYNLHALALEDDILGRQPGEPLWPGSIWTADRLRGIERRDPWTFGSMYQGNPFTPGGGMFGVDAIRVVHVRPRPCRWVRAWDFAATPDDPKADWTVGQLMGLEPTGRIVVADVVREQVGPLGVEELVRRTAEIDGPGVSISIPDDPGAAGSIVRATFIRMLHGHHVHFSAERGDKVHRAKTFAAQCAGGNVVTVRGDWNRAWLDEHKRFPVGKWDDQVDAGSRGYGFLVGSIEQQLGAPGMTYVG